MMPMSFAVSWALRVQPPHLVVRLTGKARALFIDTIFPAKVKRNHCWTVRMRIGATTTITTTGGGIAVGIVGITTAVIMRMQVLFAIIRRQLL